MAEKKKRHKCVFMGAKITKVKYICQYVHMKTVLDLISYRTLTLNYKKLNFFQNQKKEKNIIKKYIRIHERTVV